MGKILIFSGATGGGHNQVASTLKSELEQKGHEVEISDLLADYNNIIKTMCIDGYRIMYKHLGWFYGWAYRHSNVKVWSRISSAAFTKMAGKALLADLQKRSPDLIISVHPFGSGILGKLRKQGHINCPTYALITDFSVHWTHIGQGIDRYIVASDFMKHDLIKKGIKPEIIESNGIPIRKDFWEKNVLIREDGEFHILIMGGSDGESYISKSLYWISRNPECYVMVVCGNNDILKKKLTNKYSKYANITIKGYVKDIKPLMAKADLIVTKPGAITITEAISQELPIVIPYAIPGHEAANARFLVKAGVAFRPRSSIALAYMIDRMMRDPKIIDKMRQNIQEEDVKYDTNELIESIADNF